jgi:UDP-glucose 4-epimerase
VDSLVFDGCEVTVIDNLSADCHDHFYYNASKDVTYHELDINNYDDIHPLFRNVDHVFHLAAEARIQPTIEDPTLALQTNMMGTLNVLEASRLNGVKRVVYSSTSAAYGLKNNPPMVETMMSDCLNPYSVAKRAGEDLCKMYYTLYGLETVSFRYFNVYGERQPTKGQYAPVIGLFQKQNREGNPMTVVGDGLQTRDFTHVSDVVSANITMARHEDKAVCGELFNVGSGTSFAVLDLVNIIGGEDPFYTFIPERPGEARFTQSNTDKIRSFGWEPKVKLEDWLKECRLGDTC